MPLTLTPAAPLPDLNLPLVGGGEFALNVNPISKFQLLVFYRGLHCPKCKSQLQDIEANFDTLKSRGQDVIAISMDEKTRADTTVKEWALEKLLVAYDLPLSKAKDLGLFISDKYGEKEPKYFSEPALFVLNADGHLYAQYIQNTPFGRPPIMEISDGLKFVFEKGYPIRGTSTV